MTTKITVSVGNNEMRGVSVVCMNMPVAGNAPHFADSHPEGGYIVKPGETHDFYVHSHLYLVIKELPQ